MEGKQFIRTLRLRNLLSLSKEGEEIALSPPILARAINYPSRRLRRLLAVMQRLLNIDGYAVLTRDETSDTVELNRDLLGQQFDLSGH